jgi:dTDP-4-dehydrorhamnose reductase
MSTIAILGINGMLGHAMVREFAEFDGKLIGSSRLHEDVSSPVQHFFLDASTEEIPDPLHDLGPGDYVINCIGVINKSIAEESAASRQSALLTNSLFPYRLNDLASELGFKIIQIATDCVFSGEKGGYLESDLHDTIDTYGKTKSLGEVPSENMMNIRVSIIGREVSSKVSLFEWVRNQPLNSQIHGYSDHFWNGVTTQAFSRISRGIIENSRFTPGTHHLVPADIMSKFELVTAIANKIERSDIEILERPSGNRVDRTLATINSSINQQMWVNGGYTSIPRIASLVSDMDQ